MPGLGDARGVRRRLPRARPGRPRAHVSHVSRRRALDRLDPDAKGVIAGPHVHTTARDIRQAALEGVAFRFARIADPAAELNEIVATGGGLLADPVGSDHGRRSRRPVTASRSTRRRCAALRLRPWNASAEASAAPLGEVFHPREDRADHIVRPGNASSVVQELVAKTDLKLSTPPNHLRYARIAYRQQANAGHQEGDGARPADLPPLHTEGIWIT